MKLLIPLVLASAAFAFTLDSPATGESLSQRDALPEAFPEPAAAAVCHAAIYSSKKVCKNHCHGVSCHGVSCHGVSCHKTGAGSPHYWQCKCRKAARSEEDLAERAAEPEPEPVPVEDLVERAAEPELEADPVEVEEAILETRAEIKARAKCVPGSYGKKKKSCTPHSHGKGKCQRASSPGVGFIWTCNCP